MTGMYSTFFLGTLYLEHVRHYSALQTGAAFLPWTLTVAVLSQGITARLVDRFGPLSVLTSGMASAVAGLLLFATVGPDTAFFPTIFLACFAIGLGIGTAFMPLLTLAMADVPAEDAGLGSGITTLSQQIGGALGLAVLSTIAANHTKALADDHGLTSALIGGYQLAFLAGARGHRHRDRPGLRAPQTARPAAGAATGHGPAGDGGPRSPPIRHRGESSMTRLNQLAPHTTMAAPPPRAPGRPPPSTRGEETAELRRGRRLLHPRARRRRHRAPGC